MRLFSDDYIAMAMSKDIRMERNNVNVKGIHKIVGFFASLGFFVLYPLAKIPVVSDFWEMFVRCYGQSIVGFYLRSCYWKVRLQHMGENVFFDYNVHIWSPENVRIENDVHLDTGAIIWGTDGFVQIGSRINIGCYSLIQGRGGVIIEDDCGVAPHVAIYSSTHYQWFPDGRRMAASPMSKDEQYILARPIVIKHHSYIKYGSLITHGKDGVDIGPYGFVLPNSLIKSDIPSEEMWGGNPSKKIANWKENRNE